MDATCLPAHCAVSQELKKLKIIYVCERVYERALEEHYGVSGIGTCAASLICSQNGKTGRITELRSTSLLCPLFGPYSCPRACIH